MPQSRLSVSLIALCVGLAGPVFADETAIGTETRTGLAVTIYNDDLALVRDTRRVDLAGGEEDLAFVDVAAGILPETALLAAREGGLDILEQNFDFDLMTPAKLLEKSVGQKIRILRPNPETGIDTAEEAEVLAVVEGQVVLKIGDRIETQPPGRLVFSSVPANLRARPTLVVKTTNAAGEKTLDLSYLTHGLAWTADYVADLSADEKTIALNGWVTLTNRSGIAYRDAKLQLVAGSLNRVAPPMTMKGDFVQAETTTRMQMQEEAAFEYHLYTLDRPTTIKENQTKQIALMAATAIPVEKQYLMTNAANVWGRYAEAFGDAPRVNASVRLHFANDEASHLGLPLPAGIIRVYKADSDGDALFLGEDRIEHTPKNETVDLTLGEAFDVTARTRQTDHRDRGSDIYENAFEIEIKNAKDEAVTIDVREAIPGDWQILAESHPHEKLDANTAGWKIEVPASGSVKLSYRVLVDL